MSSSPSPCTHQALTVASRDLWHQCLGNLGDDALDCMLWSTSITHTGSPSSFCQSCQLGKSVRQPFSSSDHVSYFPFQLLHCDVWTSPVLSISRYQYYLAFLDDYSHFIWTFPLRHKSDVLPTLRVFSMFVQNHFHLPIQTLQSDNNGRKFDNNSSRQFYASLGIVLHMSCPYTSPQNAHAEHVLRTLNDIA